MTTALVQTGVQFPDGSVQTTAATSATGAIPVGGIILWSGSVATIPANWSLCNGSNGTPNLVDRFILSAGGSYAPGQAGGSTSIATSNLPVHSHNYSGSTGGQSNGHTHGVSDPGHSHTYGVQQPQAVVNGGWSGGTGFSQSDGQSPFNMNGSMNAAATGISIGSNQQDHSHGFSGTTDGGNGTAGAAYLQPYYALAYIMRIA